MQAAAGKGGDGIPREIIEWEEVLALLADDAGGRGETEELTSELMDVGHDPPCPPLEFLSEVAE